MTPYPPRRSVLAICLLVGATVTTFLAPGVARAAGGFGGQDLYHVPMSWCVLQGSPAQASPNILGLNGTLDSNTDAVIWRRHERPTDNIFINPTGISLRSAINDTWGSLNFPIIADTDTTNGQMGDVNGWNVNTDGTEFNNLLTACDAAYAGIGRAGIGITAININLFHDNANPGNDGDTQWDYVTTIGWGGCNESTPGNCVTPYDGRVMLIDNNFLYPTVGDRTWPPSPADLGGFTQFVLTDSLDSLTGHEVGHSLSLDHRSNTTVLMNPSISDNDSDNDADNIALNTAEVNALRANALNVPGLEIDPPGQFDPGNFLAMRLVDEDPDDMLPPYADIASVKVVMDQMGEMIHIGQTLKGIIPSDPQQTLVYIFLANTDDRRDTGCSEEELAKLGVDSSFEGADVVGRAQILAGPIIQIASSSLFGAALGETSAHHCNGAVMALDPDLYSFAIHTLRMYPRFAEASDGRVPPEVGVFDVNNTVNFRLANAALPEAIPVGSFFDVQAIVEMAGLVSDRFGDDEIGGRFVFEVPSFPHCFPLADGNPGGNVPVSYEKLLPETEIHALLGPDLVVDGVLTDADGAGEIQLPLPSDTEAGLHLVTIGHDGLALTADCTVEVVACEDDDLDPPHIDGVEAAPAMLWPPNHKMVSVEITPDAGDVCDSDPACEIVSVSSNEPVNGKGDGNTSPDWDITGDLTVDLRAERSGKGSGRIYTVEIQCTDASGQTANETTEVTVAHDQGGAKNTPMAAVKSKKTR